MRHVVPVRSPLDSDRFDLAVGRLRLGAGERLDPQSPPLDDGPFDLVIARCDASDLAAAGQLEASGGRLMDVHTTFTRRLEDADLAFADDTPDVQVAGDADADAVADLCRTAFAEVPSHYNADPRLPADRCAALYADWGRRMTLDPRTTVLVRRGDEHGPAIAAVVAFRREEGEDTVSAVLDGVHPAYRRSGLYRRLGRRRLAEARRAGAAHALVAVHLQNLPSCRANEELGYRLGGAELTFHAWRATRRTT